MKISLKERLDRATSQSRQLFSEDFTMKINKDDCLAILALLSAAQRFHERAIGPIAGSQDDDEDDLLNAIHQIESP